MSASLREKFRPDPPDLDQVNAFVVALAIVLFLLLTSLPAHLGAAEPSAAEASRAVGTEPLAPFAWTLEEAYRELQLNPRDPYLQYAVVQLARQQGKGERYLREISDQIVRPNRRSDVSLFSTFTGALAVQESLQLDTMRERDRNRQPTPQSDLVALSTLSAPTIKSHPWHEMLAGREPQVSRLSMCVPPEFYYVRFSQLSKLLEVMDQGDLWATHLLDQSVQEARSHESAGRIQRQLCLETTGLLRPFYDLAVSEVALTGSDLYLREGSDVTLLFGVQQRLLFDERMNSFLKQAEASTPGVRRETGSYRGIQFVHLTAPHRAVHVYAADPKPDLHIRSNSRAAFEMVIDVILGSSATGQPLTPLGATDELKYIRTLMPLGAPEEDGFAYLSDPFIRRMVGPTVKITELRRMQAYNHLRMLGHAQLLHRTQYGRTAESLDRLKANGCAPTAFGAAEPYLSPGGMGAYELDAGGQAVNSHYGTTEFLRPILEIPVEYATPDEARMYQEFRARYDQYWRVFFDPIAVRIRVTPEQYRLETIVLPLMDNSIYSSMARSLGGEVEPLDALPVPAGNILSVNIRFKDHQLGPSLFSDVDAQLEWDDRKINPGRNSAEAKRIVQRFFDEALGNQLGLHVYDASPLFSLSLPMLFSEFSGGTGRGLFSNSDQFTWAFLLGSLNSPVYLSVPVRNSEVTDEFLEHVSERLGVYSRKSRQAGWFNFEPDAYRIVEPGRPPVFCQTLKLGPVKWRMFWSRIGGAVYVASKQFILDDIRTAHAAAQEGGPRQDTGPAAHAMVRMRAENWRQVLPDFQLGWAENNRKASLNNISPLYGVARALLSEETAKGRKLDELDLEALSRRAVDEAVEVYGVRYYCPDGGSYVLTSDGRAMQSTLHGTPLSSRQGLAPAAVPSAKILSDVRQVTAALTFEDEGLRAVLTIDRKTP